MASPSHNNKNGTEDDDRLSALPDHILVDIMHRLDLRTLMRASTLSTRRKQLPYLLTNLYIHVDGFKPRTETSATSQLNDLVDLYTETTKRLLAPTADRSINLLRLRFCLTDPHLESIGSTVTSVLERGNTKFLEFIVVTELQDLCLRSLSVRNMRFDEPDVPNLLNSCDSGRPSVLRIDAPRSRLMELVFEFCSYVRIELVRVPKLVRVCLRYLDA
uniref:F-box domain-containing protein n=1 Tax=Setaria viridis TaxID=4556 RepID=A0A4U6T6X4_SETVI|nr:hypothetical protein SEVIR_9G501200v2 [Setaria viridis]